MPSHSSFSILHSLILIDTAMPIIDLTLTQGQFSPAQKAELAEQLTQCLLNCDVTRDNPKARTINWCYIHELPAENVYIAGQPETRPHYRIDISIMQSAISEDVKQEVVTDMTQAILNLEGNKMNPLNAARVWILFHEIRDGNWGAAGHIYRLHDLMQYLE